MFAPAEIGAPMGVYTACEYCAVTAAEGGASPNSPNLLTRLCVVVFV